VTLFLWEQDQHQLKVSVSWYILATSVFLLIYHFSFPLQYIFSVVRIKYLIWSSTVSFVKPMWRSSKITKKDSYQNLHTLKNVLRNVGHRLCDSTKERKSCDTLSSYPYSAQHFIQAWLAIPGFRKDRWKSTKEMSSHFVAYYPPPPLCICSVLSPMEKQRPRRVIRDPGSKDYMPETRRWPLPSSISCYYIHLIPLSEEDILLSYLKSLRILWENYNWVGGF
jgi:hypothetical protein